MQSCVQQIEVPFRFFAIPVWQRDKGHGHRLLLLLDQHLLCYLSGLQHDLLLSGLLLITALLDLLLLQRLMQSCGFLLSLISLLSRAMLKSSPEEGEMYSCPFLGVAHEVDKGEQQSVLASAFVCTIVCTIAMHTRPGVLVAEVVLAVREITFVHGDLLS